MTKLNIYDKQNVLLLLNVNYVPPCTMSRHSVSREYKIMIDLTSNEPSCYFCPNILTPGPKYRVYGCVNTLWNPLLFNLSNSVATLRYMCLRGAILEIA